MDNGSTSSDMQYYKSYDRIVTSKKPTLKCGTPTTNLYTTTGNANGNQQLDYPIGLITIDEVSFAGGLDGAGNSNYYLYTGQTYWTMSPYYSTSSAATVFSVYLDGRSSPYYEDINVMTSLGVRPVVNLKADILFKDGADGSKENPYVVII